MRVEIYCFMVTGLPLSRAMRTRLYAMARMMIRKGITKFSFSDESCEGQVTTKGESALLGSVGGVHFTATVAAGRSTTRVSYIVRNADLERDDDLEKLEWLCLTPAFEASPSLN